MEEAAVTTPKAGEGLNLAGRIRKFLSARETGVFIALILMAIFLSPTIRCAFSERTGIRT